MTQATNITEIAPIFRVSDLSAHHGQTFDVRPEAAQMGKIATELELLGLRKLRFAGKITAQNTRDWRLEATIGATVVQPCGITLAPVTSRIDEPVIRQFVADFEALVPEGEEVEAPEDDTIEPLQATIDINQVMLEALALALPLYPRAEGASLESATFAQPGVAPMTDEQTKPFAGLAALRDQMKPQSDQ